MENPTNGLFQFGAAIEWEDAAPGMKRKIYGHDSQLMMIKMQFEKGAVGVLHHHHHTQVAYIESGVFELTADGKKQILKQGDGYFIPSNIEHGLLCIEPGVLIEAFSPCRDDLLTK